MLFSTTLQDRLTISIAPGATILLALAFAVAMLGWKITAIAALVGGALVLAANAADFLWDVWQPDLDPGEAYPDPDEEHAPTADAPPGFKVH